MKPITKLINLTTKQEIILPYDLYPIDDLGWVDVVASQKRTLNGNLIIEQNKRVAGKPITLQSNDNLGLGMVERWVVNALREQAQILSQKFELHYIADGENKVLTVAFDHSQEPINAKPFKDFNSPNPDDLFSITLKFVTVVEK